MVTNNGFAGPDWRRDFVANARLNEQLDLTFGNGGVVTNGLFHRGNTNETASQAIVQPDSRIIIAGADGVIRYLTNGELDVSFGLGGKVEFFAVATSVALQSDGKVVVAGYYNNGGNLDFALARFDSNGILDPLFSGDGKVITAIGTSADVAYGVAIKAMAKSCWLARTISGVALVRYNSDGSLDNTFDGDGKVTTAIGISNGIAYGVAIQSDGKIVVAGSVFNGGNNDFALIRYNSNGALDMSFNGKWAGDNSAGYLARRCSKRRRTIRRPDRCGCF